ncbi:MAG: class I adenylate cyclase [Desulfobacterales bacterium]|nr:class I adenylate cyclase [Desulfobacterales bacterium]
MAAKPRSPARPGKEATSVQGPGFNVSDIKTVQRVLSHNKRKFLEYNNFRKNVFSELAPGDCDAILYMLPWLLSVNEPGVPGYLDRIKAPFRVYGIETTKEIRSREGEFKKRFGIRGKGSLLKSAPTSFTILGLYTIGSVGSVSQTSESDCDIWLCIDKSHFDKTAWRQINQKVNLIKDWMDQNLKIPVYFFVSDITAIRECRFGSVDAESSGSTQQNVLKEEFYRTCIVIAGKLPLWWLCYDPHLQIQYNDALSAVADEDYWEYDLVDFGDIESVSRKEYFGGALWQLHKSLSNPLKSIIKMSLLKVLLDAPQDALMCHRFREKVLSCDGAKPFPDFSIFTMRAIAENYRSTKPKALNFLIECLYIRCEINPYNRNQKLKNRLAGDFFRDYPLNKDRQKVLRDAGSWKFQDQLKLGDRLFRLLLEIYREIADNQGGIESESDRRDLTIIGRKISAFYLKKDFKVPVLQTPKGRLNISTLSLRLDKDIWRLFSGNDNATPVVSSRDIVHGIAFVVWNRLFVSGRLNMRPNPSNITLQEVLNLGRKITQFFGDYGSQEIDYTSYLQTETIDKMLVIVGLEQSPWDSKNRDVRVVYTNGWGELFVRRFKTLAEYESFSREATSGGDRRVEMAHHVLRNATAYEKIIERTKQDLMPSLFSGKGRP